MARASLPMASDKLGIRPPLPSQIPVSDEVMQTIALLLGYCRGERIVLQASPAGILYAASPRLVDVFHWTAAAPNAAKQGDNIVCTEIICIGHPDNGSKVWVRTGKAATTANAIPLDAGDVVGFSVENLSDLHALIVANTERLIVGYSL